MNSTSTLIPSSLQLLLLVSLALFLPSIKSSSDYSTLVYKNCASQTFTSTSISHSQTLSSLFQELVAHSSQSKFFKTIEGNSETAISGLFQCRGDMSDEECHNCVNAIPQMSDSLCSLAMAARIQLFGCYTHYEADGFHEPDATTSKTNLLYKICGESEAVDGGFVELRDAAFAALESGVVSGNGFFSSSYDSVQVTAQCEGDLGGCDCGECVNNAVQVAQEECGNSVSGEIYLDKCFISYSYYPDGTHGNSKHEGQKGKNSSGNKTAAIVVGGAAALFLGFIFFSCIKSWNKKDDD
ncbi:plasmodesmata-located protein 2-like [Quercus lobata]|uniref:Gnk2-homologous domain-containing protein n=1 Tax=Quercus lobata TaxID=97700 RepID=A0A7N2L632_QUELO|nr:plasmodesmata-located protein 2-like [Quercus lobata]